MSKDIVVPYNFRPRWYQLEVFQALDSGKKRAFLRWHRRAGKDKACFAYMAKEMVKRPGVYYYVFPSYAQGRKILWEGSDKQGFKFLKHIPQELVARQNNQEMILELKNGTVFRVVGADAEKVDDLVGTNPVGVVMSEFGVEESYSKVLDFFRPILRENGGWLIINGTPRGRNHMYKLEQKIKHNPEWFCSSLQTIAPGYPTGRYTGCVKEDGIEAERAEGMEESMIEQEYGVSYTATSRGRIYEHEIHRARAEGRIGSWVAEDHRVVDTFWDLGVSDATAIWFRQMDGNRKIFIDYYEAESRKLDHYIDVLRSKGYRFGTHYLPHDGRNRNIQTSTTTAELLDILIRDAQVGGTVITCDRPGRKADTINGVRKLLPTCYFNESTCGEGVDKLSLYHYKLDAKKGILLKEPQHDFTSHCADAFGLQVYAPEREDEYEDMYIEQDVSSFNPLDW